MNRAAWDRIKAVGRRGMAAAPAMAAVLGAAMAAGSSPLPNPDREALPLAGRVDTTGLMVVSKDDPLMRQAALQGLAPGQGAPLSLTAAGLEARKLNAAMPAALNALKPARAFAFTPRTAEDRHRALRCLTQAVYYEAALEPTLGQEGVAQVVLNRVRDPNYPASICGVVFQGAERTTGCQFSFTCDGALAQAPVGWAWDRARRVAERALAGHVSPHVGTATHYHADYVYPWWAPTLAKITKVGAHIFYRWKGVSGDTAAFRQAYSGREPVIDEVRFARPRLMLASVETPVEGAATAPGQMESAAVGGVEMRTIEIEGRTRVVGVASLGGRRLPTREEVARINAQLAAAQAPTPTVTLFPSPPGVTTMDVEEVGRPTPAPPASAGGAGA